MSVVLNFSYLAIIFLFNIFYLFVFIFSCGAIGAPDGCEWGDYVNESADFPACCARYLNCVGGLNNETQSYQKNIWEMFSPDLKISGLEDAAAAKQQ